VNITDINIKDLWSKAVELYGTDDPLEIVFARQRELMKKYLVIEAEILDEELVTIPVDIHSARGQRSLKERAWWMVEELVEALDALEEGNDTKFLEEMSDALHFLTELWVLGDLDSSSIESKNFDSPSPVDGEGTKVHEIRPQILDIIVSLGRAVWLLRNKSGKVSQVLTDIPHFTHHLQRTYDQFLNLLHNNYDMGMKDICLLYLRKSEVNKFRQKSQY